MRVSDNQSPVTRGNGCRTTRLPHGKGRRVIRGPRIASSLMAVFVVLTAVCAAESEPKRVLVIRSFGSVAPPFTTHSIAFETELVEKMGKRVDLDEVSLEYGALRRSKPAGGPRRVPAKTAGTLATGLSSANRVTRGCLRGAIPGPPVSRSSHPLHRNGSPALISPCAGEKRRFHW